jgi:hypothetical protein
MERKGIILSGVPILEKKQWITGFYNMGILNLLEILHFGRGKDVNNCFKRLLALVHGGVLWMDRPFSINVDLIVAIKNMPIDLEKQEQYMDEKTTEKALTKEMKKTYGIERWS